MIGNADNAGRVISTKSILERNLTAGVASGGNSTSTPARLGLNLNFTSTSAEGAILVLPEGASTEDILKLGPFEDEARENGESWYRYAWVDRGRTSINNDSLYLITGYHKASSWAVAAFSDASGSAGLNATFTAGLVAGGNIAAAYSWQVTNSIHWRVGPVERHSINSRNQAVFIRGFKIALRGSLLALFRGPVKVSLRSPGTKSSTWRAYLPQFISPGNRAQGYGELQRQSPWDVSTDDNENADDSEEENLVDSHNTSIELSPFPSNARKAYHPSDVINRFLLHSEPRANIAITHDTQWMGFFEEGSPIRDDELIKHIQHHFQVKYNDTGGGSVYLDERMQQDSQSSRDNDKGMNLTEKDSSEGVHAALTSRSDGLSTMPQEVIPHAERHSSEQLSPSAKTRLGALSALVLRLIGHSAQPNPMEGEEEKTLRAEIISAAASTEVVEKSGTNNTVTLTFSRPPNDVTEYIKRMSPYADDTSGGFSDVFKCVLDKPGEPRTVVAVKALRPGTNNATDLQARGNKLRAEVHIWIRLDHPNVLKLHGITDGFSSLPALVSPWVENGTLTKYLEGPGRGISTEERITILLRVGEALHYIHSAPHHVVHGDLSGSNILIDGDGQPLISDFTLASILEEYNDTPYFKDHRLGAIRWVAPELLGALEESPKPSTESDVYSFGCVMLHMLSGKVPYSEIEDYEIPFAKMDKICLQRPTNLPIQDTVWKWIKLCLDATPGNRPKLPDIISFLSGV